MFAANEVEVVAQVILIANESSRIGLPRIEVAAHVDSFNGFGGRRLPDVDAQIGKANASFGWTAIRGFAREAGAEFVDCGGAEHVSLADQSVLRNDGREILKAQIV